MTRELFETNDLQDHFFENADVQKFLDMHMGSVCRYQTLGFCRFLFDHGVGYKHIHRYDQIYEPSTGSAYHMIWYNNELSNHSVCHHIAAPTRTDKY